MTTDTGFGNNGPGAIERGQSVASAAFISDGAKIDLKAKDEIACLPVVAKLSASESAG